MNLKALADGIIAAVKGHTAKALAPRDARLDALERRLAELEGAHTKALEFGASLERRASRHAEHLANLQTKLRTLERGTTQ